MIPDQTDPRALVERLTELRNAASKGDLNTAEYKEKGWFECHFCDGAGSVEGEQFINYDGVAANVLFSGIGSEFGANEKFYTEICREWCNVAAALTAALDRAEVAEARLVECSSRLGQEAVRANVACSEARTAWNDAIEAATQRMRVFMINDTALPETLIQDVSESVLALRKGDPT